MIRAAFEYLISLGHAKTIDIDGQAYSPQNLIHVKHPKVDGINITSLTGLVDYLKSRFDENWFSGNLIHIVSHDKVNLISNILKDSGRETYMTARPFSPKFAFDLFYNIENFIISMQACFMPNEDTARILKVVGNLKEETVRQTSDDGVSQAVTAKSGIATVETVTVPNPVILAPYRTFVEIEQPESKFVFRMKATEKGPCCALFEADGGAWKLEAMKSIKDFLERELKGTGVPIIS